MLCFWWKPCWNIFCPSTSWRLWWRTTFKKRKWRGGYGPTVSQDFLEEEAKDTGCLEFVRYEARVKRLTDERKQTAAGRTSSNKCSLSLLFSSHLLGVFFPSRSSHLRLPCYRETSSSLFLNVLNITTFLNFHRLLIFMKLLPPDHYGCFIFFSSPQRMAVKRPAVFFSPSSSCPLWPLWASCLGLWWRKASSALSHIFPGFPLLQDRDLCSHLNSSLHPSSRVLQNRLKGINERMNSLWYWDNIFKSK